ncbi:uncharacterized protein K460DRAFT_281206 [Cucurbitaria berberidis CBS 394.84]|uniref:Uncharacterized protein n=1 Tax=Cucurbitaria berberidis CBS 394.84 TaxID=1168544 RepID=A0A9P4GMK9_9PLEO|nr:uncharacterized protein K460DRAFT_281206 [Cucurbitaria berberidis CBS 394.84]KAF1848417.1 hypothetical protein K460DRAFT_281206 [Cucurbitaria berberidis CBS 394.84]
MKQSATLFSLVAALPVAHAITFGSPAPTATSPKRALDGTNPNLTKGPSVNEWMTHQDNTASGITCNAGRTCILLKSASIGMAGCCDGVDTQDCGWSPQCVDYRVYVGGNFSTKCMLNGFVHKCTDVLSPQCVTWTYPSDGVAHYGCAATSSNTIYTSLQHATDCLGDTKSMELPTVSGNGITGFKKATSTAVEPTHMPSGGGGNSSSGTRTTKKIAIGLIVGIITAIFHILFGIIVPLQTISDSSRRGARSGRD